VQHVKQLKEKIAIKMSFPVDFSSLNGLPKKVGLPVMQKWNESSASTKTILRENCLD